jgi:hypothetical protein
MKRQHQSHSHILGDSMNKLQVKTCRSIVTSAMELMSWTCVSHICSQRVKPAWTQQTDGTTMEGNKKHNGSEARHGLGSMDLSI